ncbi:ATP-binding cassette domain-containing protein [Colwellia echini]|uniref:ATP-binding cassette domain-containing protein n=1 Tax=Colwellia echini TaxID=1982103 RepID=A0ABY3N0L8_9GAMM|nr:ATP-binding cassette domain-containing protein [Colwellia echini]TYK67041.1 ATP-binding cassette domain-containing protein [Colwellia echini]
MFTIKNYYHPSLMIENWSIEQAKSWCVFGTNDSGRQSIAHLLTGELAPSTVETLDLPNSNDIAVISFEEQQKIYEHELKIEATDDINQQDFGTLVCEFLPADKLNDPLIKMVGLDKLLHSGYRQLSSGEGRKLLLLAAILQGKKLLICEDPFDSLDKESCYILNQLFINVINERNTSLMLLLGNRSDVPAWCEKIAIIKHGELSVIGDQHNNTTQQRLNEFFNTDNDEPIELPEEFRKDRLYPHEYLFKLVNGAVRYQNKTVFEGLNISVKPKQHTLITGKNGSGKSTLLNLITGECTQCYSNDLTLFGFKRGSGESIWELKANMGIVTPELHRQYRINGTLLSVVLSGLFDSIGLYQQTENYQAVYARQWLKKVGLDQKEKALFNELSFGEQRLALIVRALIKAPLLLILDEITQGLDEFNRHRILKIIKMIMKDSQSTILFVTHRQDELLDTFSQHIRL